MIVNISSTQYDVVAEAVLQVGMKITRRNGVDNDWDVFWQDLAVNAEFVKRMKPHQRINHHPAIYELS